MLSLRRHGPAATGLAVGVLLCLAGVAVAQERLPWDDRREAQERRPIQPYDGRADSGSERFDSAPYEPRRDNGWGSNNGGSAYGDRTYGGGAAGPVYPRDGGRSFAERGRDDAYRPPANEAWRRDDEGRRQPVPYGGEPYGSDGGRGGYGAPSYGRPYETAPGYEQRDAYNAPPRSYERYERYDEAPPPRDGTFSMREVRDAGHGFFGSISQGLASVIEYAFQKQGRPNGYILGEDLGGAFVAGLRYGEGMLHTKDAGHHKVYWQGPSLGYDAGAEGSKVMVLVYNLRDPAEIYQRFGGIAGSAYVVGGVGLTFQSHGDIVLAPIRSGIGLRLGANIGYLKYTRRPTWNPF